MVLSIFIMGRKNSIMQLRVDYTPCASAWHSKRWRPLSSSPQDFLWFACAEGFFLDYTACSLHDSCFGRMSFNRENNTLPNYL